MPEAEDKTDEESLKEKAHLPKIQPEILKEYASPACSYPEFSDDFDEKRFTLLNKKSLNYVSHSTSN